MANNAARPSDATLFEDVIASIGWIADEAFGNAARQEVIHRMAVEAGAGQLRVVRPAEGYGA